MYYFLWMGIKIGWLVFESEPKPSFRDRNKMRGDAKSKTSHLAYMFRLQI